jgi:hypothetical protein
MTFEEEVTSILQPSEWRDDPTQAAEDLYDLMGDAEERLDQKLFLLRNLRNSATETALKTYFSLFFFPHQETGVDDRISSEDNRRVLAKLRNWFTAAIKANDKNLLSVLLEVCLRVIGLTLAY